MYAGAAKDGTPVAVKVVELGAGMASRLRLREKQIAEKLQGVDAQHLILVLDTAEVDGKLLIVMERAERSLASELGSRGSLGEDEAVGILRDVTAGLRELHQASVIHRDLKPGNILLHEERWKLADFGIARDVEVGTQSATFIGAGTFPYMAPETWRAQTPTFKTDLYALGCVAYELAAGAPPFRGPEEDDFARQHLEERPSEPPVDDPRLKRLILRLLSKDPAERHQDARSVEEVLARTGRTAGAGVLAGLAVQHAEERSAEDARKAAEETAAARRRELGRQAAEDLEDLLTDATDLIREQIPEADFSWTGSVPAVSSDDAALKLHMRPGLDTPVEQDEIVGFGEVSGENRRGGNLLLANILYEPDDKGRYGWTVYRFRAQASVTDYPFGPRGREHGLSASQFASQREYMRSNVTHVFVHSASPLTSDSIVGLFTEAMALPAPPGPSPSRVW